MRRLGIIEIVGYVLVALLLIRALLYLTIGR